jgi:hypothetical protein
VNVIRSGRPSIWKTLVVLASVVALVGTGCSKNRSSGGGGPHLTKIFVQKFRFHGMPTHLSSGLNEFLFQNQESFPITHEMIPVALPSGKTPQDITSDAKKKGPSSEDDWLHIGGDFGGADTGAGLVELVYLPPGNYAIACWRTGRPNGKLNGPPHAAIGMVFGFSVS